MKHIYHKILEAMQKREKLLAVLIDPEKTACEHLESLFEKLHGSIVTHIFVGGSTVAETLTAPLVLEMKKHTELPVVLFPGDVGQIAQTADALLFLSLISGDNPDYLIKKHIASVSKLRDSNLEIIPTGYVLIENGKETAIQKVTGTMPMPRTNIQDIVDTAKAGELLGMKLIYLEAGSGALHPVPPGIVKSVKQDLNIPLIVGGGIRSKAQLEMAYHAGADMVVIGTAFEKDEAFFEALK